MRAVRVVLYPLTTERTMWWIVSGLIIVAIAVSVWAARRARGHSRAGALPVQPPIETTTGGGAGVANAPLSAHDNATKHAADAAPVPDGSVKGDG